MVQFIALGRVGQPADIAGLIAFLCGPDAEFMTGSYLIMDGGLRDASSNMILDPNDPRSQEFQRHMLEAQKRREKLQPLIDER